MRPTHDRAKDAICNKMLVVGCSGATSIGRAEILGMASETLIVSATSDQREIGLLDLKAISEKPEPLIYRDQIAGTMCRVRGSGTRLCLLADGYSINFWASESMPDQVSDFIMTLVLLAMVDICQHYKDYAPGINSDAVNTLTETYEVAKLYMERYCPKG